MRIIQKVNLQDNTVKISRDVFEVYEVNDDKNMTLHKITHKKKSKIEIQQPSLFDDIDFN